jgi:autotransporter-associated beta strand protein
MKNSPPILIRHLSCMVAAFLCATSLALSQQLNVLVIGSTRSFSEGNESGVVQEKAFNPTAIATHLQSILAQDPLITETVNVEFEDIYKTKAQTVNYSGSLVEDYTSRCYSLAQHFMWTDGKAARLANLRGEGARVWDYIVLCNDPYITANFPGMVAEGVKMIKDEVAQSANPAQVVLLGQWPESTSTFTANQFNEIAYRVGNSAGLTVVPAGKAWDSYGSKDTSANHPTPRGEYLAAASIYSRLFNRSAKTSAYDYPAVGDAIADHALSVIQANTGVAQYTGTYTSFNPFQMKYLTKRTVNYRETGTSTEDRIAQALDRLDDVQRITFSTSGYAGSPGTRWDFNYGRGNDRWEDDKDYEVDQNKYDWVYGFPMHHYSTTSAPVTMPFGIDKHYLNGTSYEDGTDIGIAYNMIRPGTREPDWPEAVRAIPIRLMWLKMAEISPGFNPLGDSTHMHPNLNDASAAFMYTLISGRCPVVAEPTPQGSSNPAWMQWLGHKIGYETAWQMSHLTTRAPGFQVMPSDRTVTTVSPTTTETMTVQFTYPPQANVTVTVASSSSTAAIVSPKTLVFTPSNYNTPQQVKVAGIPGTTASPTFNVNFTTSSTDEIYHGLSDSWAYTNNRSATAGITQVENASIPVVVEQYTPKIINLGVSAANASNTIFAGPHNGSIIWQSNGVIQYTPTGNYIGTDQIVFAVTNGTAQTLGTIDITVAVPEGQVNVTATDASASETSPDNGTFVISRAGSTASPLNVLFTLSGTATLTSDYTLSHTSPVTIPAGQSSVTITLTPVDDATFGEGIETSILNITPNAAYPIGIASATISIADNDNTAPVVNAGTDQTVTMNAGSPWSPAETTTQLWLDANDATTIMLDGSAVTDWNDKSNNNRNASQTTAANQPALTTTGLNGKNTITFDGNSDFLNLGTGLDFLAGTSHSAFIVVANLSTYSNIYGAANGNSGSGSLHAGFSNGTTYRLNYWGHDYTTAVTTNFTNTGSILNYVWPVGSPKQILANGKLEGSGHNALAPAAMAGGGRIGNIVGQGYIGGRIAEMVFLTGTVNQSDRERMEGYLAHKWGLTDNLDTNHPYKTLMPGGSSALATLDATVTDADGQTPTALWTKVSGPGTVTFANASAIDTTATFTMAGVYTLRLTANDGFGPVSDDIVITVNAAPSTSTVTYDGNGSTGGSAPVDASSPYTNGSTVTVLGNTGSLVRSVFTFNGWNTAANGSGTSYAPAATFNISANTTLFAQWTALPSVTVTYNGNGSTGGTVPVDSISPYTSGSIVTVLGNTGSLVRSGHTFIGWNTAADGSGASYAPGQTFSISTATSLFAQWSAIAPIKVFLLAGQSNMQGNNALLGQLPAYLQPPQDDVLLYSETNSAAFFGSLQVGAGNNFGPEISFGRAIADARPNERFALIKFAQGATNLHNNWDPATGSVYSTFRTTVTNGLEALSRTGQPYQIVGMLWTQGENDVQDLRTTAQYQADLNEFIADVRTRYGANLPFFISRLSNNQTWRDITQVRTAQENVDAADPNAYLINTDGFDMRSDALHFEETGYVALGQAFATSYLGMNETTAPAIRTLNPANAATAVHPTANLSITFNEPVVFGTGAITLRQSGGALIESFNVASPPAGLTRSGATVTINPTSLLAPSTGYYVEIDATAIDDLAGNSFPGFSGSSTWSFTTSAADNTPPIISSISPAHSATGVLFNSNLRITFSENITFGTGEIRLRQSGGALVQAFDVANPPVGLSLAGDTITLNPSADLGISTSYYIEIDATAIDDIAGNSFAGFNGSGTWSFTTAAAIIPGSKITASASNYGESSHPFRTIDGSGLSTGVHGVVRNTAWYGGNDSNHWIQWDLGASYTLDSIQVWNYKDLPWIASARSVDIYFSNVAIPGDPEGIGAGNWTRLGGTSVELPDAPASNNTGFNLAAATGTTLPSTEVRYIRFELNTNWGANSTGLAEIQFTAKPSGPDTTAPSVSTLSPAQTATGVSPSSNLSVTFNESVAFGTGAIRIRRQSDNSLIESFNVASPPGGLTLSGATVTINPTADLANLTTYYVEIDNGAIKDLSNNSFPGFTGSGTWSFTTVAAETIPPVINSLSPAHNSTGVAVASNLAITFSENVAFGTGAITLRQSGGALVESFNVASPPSGLTLSGATVTINPTADLSTSTTYYVEIDATAIDDLSNNSFAGFTGSGTWSFTTFVPDTTPPAISSRNPANGATNVSPSANLVITFSENIAFGTGAITLRQSGGALIESFNVASPPSGLTLSGATVTINPTSDLALATTYYVEIDNGAIKDLSNNNFAGFTGSGTWSFSTTAPDTTPPAISTLNPANGATGVSPSANLSITFSENIAFGTGAITLRQSGGTLVESFNVANPPGGLTLSGATVTLNPAANLTPATTYYVEIDATAIDDLAGNSFPGINGTGTWSFTISITGQSALVLANSYLTSLDIASPLALLPAGGFPSFMVGPLTGSSNLTLAGGFTQTTGTNGTVSFTNHGSGNTFNGNIIIESGTLRVAGSPFASNGGFTAPGMTSSNTITIERAGTLLMDDNVTGGHTVDRFGSGASSARPAVVMNGGAITLSGFNNASVMNQTFGDLTLNAGLSTFTVNRNSNGTPTLVFDSLTQASGSFAQFSSNTTLGSAATNVARITFTTPPATIGGGGADGSNTISLVKGARLPVASGTSNFIVNGAHGLRQLAFSTETQDLGSDINGATANANARLNDGAATSMAALTAPRTVNSLIIGGTAINTTQTWAMGNTLTLTSGMLMRTHMNAPFTFTSGTLTAGDGTNPADLSLSVPNGTMIIGGTATIANNGSSVVSLVVPDNMTINSSGNSSYSGGTYVLGGTLSLGNVSNTRYLGAGRVFVNAGILTLGHIGATSFSGSLASPTFTVTNGGRIGITSNNHGATEFFNIGANSIIAGASGSGTGLASLTRGTNITLAPGAIIAHGSQSAALNLTTGTIQNPGAAADLFYGLNGNQNSATGSVQIGNATAFRGISTDRSDRSWEQGTINIAAGTASVDFQGHATLPNATNLTLGTGTGNATFPTISSAVTGTVDIKAIGRVTLNDDLAVYGNTGAGQNIRFVATPGSLFTVTPATGMGSGNGIAGAVIQSGGTLAIGNAAALNGAVTVQAGAQFNANQAGGLTGTGALTFNEGSIVLISGNAVAFSGSQATAATIYPGTLVRAATANFGSAGTTLDSILGSGANSVSYITQGNDAANPTNPNTAVYTLNKSVGGIGGVLTNDQAVNRTITNLANGNITLGTNGGVIAATTNSTLTISEDITGNGSLTIGTTSVIDGMPKLGTVSLNSANNHTGGTIVNAGTLTMGNAAALGSTSGPLTVNGGTLNMAANSLTVGNLTGTGGVISGTSGTRTLTIGQGDFGGGNFQGVIANGSGGTTALTKTGTGTITLSGFNTYTGATAINAGKLFINGNQSAATGNVTVNATLGGKGIIGGNTTIAAGGMLEFDLGANATSHDKLELTATRTLIFSGASTLTLTSTGGSQPGDYTLITAPGGFGSSVPPSNVILPAGWTYDAPRFVGSDLKINITSTGVITDPYAAWAVGGVAFDADANNDGIPNGMAFLLGASSPTSAVTRPIVSQTVSGLVIQFNMLKPSNRGTATIGVQHSRDIGGDDPWTTVPVPNSSGGPTNGVTFLVTPGGGTVDTVQATISSSEAEGTGKLFGRLRALNP